MNDWFSWNGKKCTEYGIHVLEQPPITIPAERATFTNVPGRPGSLTMLEGDDVYDDMILTAQCMISDPGDIHTIHHTSRCMGYRKTRMTCRRTCAKEAKATPTVCKPNNSVNRRLPKLECLTTGYA